MSHSSSSSSERESRATSRKCMKDVRPRGTQRENQHCCLKPSGTAIRHSYKTHTQLIKEKLDHVKAEMQRISVAHLDQRPERKAYHPFVWNSLSPYKDTTEIDHLLTVSADQSRRSNRSSVKKSRKHSNI